MVQMFSLRGKKDRTYTTKGVKVKLKCKFNRHDWDIVGKTYKAHRGNNKMSLKCKNCGAQKEEYHGQS